MATLEALAIALASELSAMANDGVIRDEYSLHDVLDALDLSGCVQALETLRP